MTVEIPADLQAFVDQAVHSGSYQSEAEVIGQALRLLRQREERIEELRREIQPALDQLDRGEGIVLNGEEELRAFFDDIMARGHAELAAERESRNETV